MSAMTRSPLLVAAVAAALAIGACGGGGGSTGASSQDDKAFAGALKFAKCMREHGIDMPDPERDNGGIKWQPFTAGSRAAMQAAQKACQKYRQAGGGRAPSAAEQAKIKNAMLAYAKCMRDHGIAVPDPKFTGGGIQFEPGSSGRNPNSPAFKAADQACHYTLSGLPQKFRAGPLGGSKEKQR
jgi:hypothetical protein